MKSMTLIIAAVLCAAYSASVYADLSGTFKTIVVDGSLSDWSSPGDVLYDDAEIGDGAPANSSYEVVYAANDAANLYFGLDTKGTGGGSVSNNWFRNVYLDTDGDAGTGYDGGWFSHGYDRLIQYGASGTSYSVFEFTGATQGEWTWTFLSEITYSYSDDVVEISVPLSSLGVVSNSIIIEANATGGDVTIETWASEFESSAETYTVAEASVANITLDGSLDDWDAGSLFYTDAEISDGSPSNSSYEAVYVANDATSLYFGLDTKGSGGADITNSWTRNFYLDTDGNAGTGFNAGWMTHGFDRLVQFGSGGTTYSVFEFTGATQGEWTWNWLGLISYSYSDDIIELSIPLSWLGVVDDSIVVELNVTGTGITTETWAHESEASAKTYPVVVPTNKQPKTITLDGSLDDWDNPEDVFYVDAEIADGSPSNSSYETVYLVNDTTNLYVGLDMKGAGGADITNNWWHNIFIDTDVDPDTGYDAGWMVNGYDILLEYGNTNGGSSYTVYDFTGATQVDWAWSVVGQFSYAHSNDVVELAIPLSLLGLSGTSFVMELNVTGGDVTTETWASEYETGAKTYTLALGDGPSPIGTISIANIPGTGVAISWNAIIGQSYDVVYKNDLTSDPSWLNYTNIVAPVSGDMAVTSAVDQAKTFYRVETP